MLHNWLRGLSVWDFLFRRLQNMVGVTTYFSLGGRAGCQSGAVPRVAGEWHFLCIYPIHTLFASIPYSRLHQWYGPVARRGNEGVYSPQKSNTLLHLR